SIARFMAVVSRSLTSAALGKLPVVRTNSKDETDTPRRHLQMKVYVTSLRHDTFSGVLGTQLPSISSTVKSSKAVVQWPDSVSQPSKGLEKSNPSPNAADRATWSAADRPRPKAVLPATSWRLDMSLTIYFLLPMERRCRDAVDGWR